MKIDTELLKKFNAGEAITDAKLEKPLTPAKTRRRMGIFLTEEPKGVIPYIAI
jgi:hypothetical protein